MFHVSAATRVNNTAVERRQVVQLAYITTTGRPGNVSRQRAKQAPFSLCSHNVAYSACLNSGSWTVCMVLFTWNCIGE